MTLPGAVTAEDDEQRARSARTARSARSCTPATRSGTGTTTSAPTSRGCWSRAGVAESGDEARSTGATSPRHPAGRWTRPRTTSRRTAAPSSPRGDTADAPASTARAGRALDVATGRPPGAARRPRPRLRRPRVSPDGAPSPSCASAAPDPDRAPSTCGWSSSPLDGGEPAEVAPGWDRWVDAVRWAPDGVGADRHRRRPRPRARCSASTSRPATVTRLTGDDGAYTDPAVSPDGRRVYALRNAVDAPPAPVRRRRRRRPTSEPVPLPGPVAAPGAARDGSPR